MIGLTPGLVRVPTYGLVREIIHKRGRVHLIRAAARFEGGVDRRDWRYPAAFRDVDPELFFPIGNTGPALLQIDEARQVCRRCPVMEPCLEWAIDSGQDAGVWGGLSEDERRALKRRGARVGASA